MDVSKISKNLHLDGKANYPMTNYILEAYYASSRLIYRHTHGKMTARDAENYRRIMDARFIAWPDLESQFSEISRLDRNRWQRIKRTRKYMSDMLQVFNEQKVCFLTFTFSDESLQTYDEKRLVKATRQYLSDNYDDYYANTDYGKEKGRFHIHALVVWRGQKTPAFKYGYVKTTYVKDEQGLKRKIKYLNKFAFHAGKITTGESFHPRKRHVFEDWMLDNSLPF